MKLFDFERISVMNNHYEYYTIDYFLECQAKLGIKNVELLGGRQGLWMDPYGYQDAAPIRKRLEELGLKCPVFTPDNCSYGYQFGVKEPKLVELTFNHFANGIRFGAELGAKIFECNSGWGYWNEDQDEAMKRAADLLRRLTEFAEQFGMRLACESLRPQESRYGFTLPQIKKLVDLVDHPGFRPMIDLTAISVSGETIQDWFDVFGKGGIIHCHFQDCNPYGHLIWGDGCRNLEQELRAMLDNGYEGFFSQEITDRRYYPDPFFFDSRNVYNLKKYTV